MGVGEMGVKFVGVGFSCLNMDLIDLPVARFICKVGFESVGGSEAVGEGAFGELMRFGHLGGRAGLSMKMRIDALEEMGGIFAGGDFYSMTQRWNWIERILSKVTRKSKHCAFVGFIVMTRCCSQNTGFASLGGIGAFDGVGIAHSKQTRGAFWMILGGFQNVGRQTSR